MSSAGSATSRAKGIVAVTSPRDSRTKISYTGAVSPLTAAVIAPLVVAGIAAPLAAASATAPPAATGVVIPPVAVGGEAPPAAVGEAIPRAAPIPAGVVMPPAAAITWSSLSPPDESGTLAPGTTSPATVTALASLFLTITSA